jgi:hypothetical protein
VGDIAAQYSAPVDLKMLHWEEIDVGVAGMMVLAEKEADIGLVVARTVNLWQVGDRIDVKNLVGTFQTETLLGLLPLNDSRELSTMEH